MQKLTETNTVYLDMSFVTICVYNDRLSFSEFYFTRLNSEMAVDRETNVLSVVAGKDDTVGAVHSTLDLLSLGYGCMMANSLTRHRTDSGMLFDACFLPFSTCINLQE